VSLNRFVLDDEQFVCSSLSAAKPNSQWLPPYGDAKKSRKHLFTCGPGSWTAPDRAIAPALDSTSPAWPRSVKMTIGRVSRMRWRKLGRVYAPNGERWWSRTHAYLPTAALMPGGELRVYFSCLDDQQMGHVAFVDFDVRDPKRVLYVSPDTVLDIGRPGMFDDCGVNRPVLLQHQGRVWLYCIGWQGMVGALYG
jgi:hypothetical protein